MKTTHIESPCPACSALLEEATSLGDTSPRPGDIGICAECQDLHVFDDNLKRRKITEADMDAMPLDQITALQMVITTVKGAINLDNWSTASRPIPYQPPECWPTILQGNVSGHPDMDDGEFVHTSPIAKANGQLITTESGTLYRLGKIDPKFREFLKTDRPNWDPENPITIVKVTF